LRDSAGITPDFAGNHDTPLLRGGEDPTSGTGQQTSYPAKQSRRQDHRGSALRETSDPEGSGVGYTDAASMEAHIGIVAERARAAMPRRSTRR
jgi:hypothetical protein